MPTESLQNLPKRPTAGDILKLYKNKEATVSEVVEYFLKRIEEVDPEINAFVRVTEDFAREKAKELDEILESKNFDEIIEEMPLFGVPFAIKDLILVEGETITAQSKILEGYKSAYSSDIYKNMEKARAVLLGITNMDEFAFGSSTEYSGYGQITKNPFDKTRVPGGTSGGSASAVASGQIPIALGSDTGGSIRQPASFCDIVGMRPTYGLVSRYGVVSSASSFDQVGPLTNSIQDNELVLKIISNKGTKDQTKLKQNLSPISDNEEPIKIGIPKACFGEGISDSVKIKFEEIFNILNKNQNFKIKEIELPSLDYALETYYILQTVEASANLERYDGVRYGKQSDKELFFGSRGDYFGGEVTRRIMIGTYASSSGYYDAYYNQACKTRGKLKEDFKRAFGEVDIMIMPASPFPAFKIGENSNNEDPMAMYLADTMTVPEAVGSLPGLVIPGGFVEHEGSNLPVGIQLVGPELSEDVLYDVGEKLEKVL